AGPGFGRVGPRTVGTGGESLVRWAGGVKDGRAYPSPARWDILPPTSPHFREGLPMGGRMTRPRSVLLTWVLIGALAVPLVPFSHASAQQTTLVVTGYGGRWSEVMKKALVEPFEKKHGVKVEIVTGITTEWVAKTLAPNIKNLYPKALIGDTSLAMFWGRIGLAYRTDSGIKKPTSWKDFWDEAYVGKRATYIIGNTLGINFLFISSKLFGKDYFDVDAGVAAIKRAQPKLVDFTGTVEKQLEQKEVVLAVLHDASAYDLQKRGIPVDWVAPSEGQPILDQIVQVTRGSKNKELAWKLIDAYLSPEVQ